MPTQRGVERENRPSSRSSRSMIPDVSSPPINYDLPRGYSVFEVMHCAIAGWSTRHVLAAKRRIMGYEHDVRMTELDHEEEYINEQVPIVEATRRLSEAEHDVALGLTLDNATEAQVELLLAPEVLKERMLLARDLIRKSRLTGCPLPKAIESSTAPPQPTARIAAAEHEAEPTALPEEPPRKKPRQLKPAAPEKSDAAGMHPFEPEITDEEVEGMCLRIVGRVAFLKPEQAQIALDACTAELEDKLPLYAAAEVKRRSLQMLGLTR